MAFTPTRREFVKLGAMASAGLLLGRGRVAAQFAQTPPGLQLFLQPLRTLAAMAPAARVTFADPDVDYYEIAMRQFEDRLHPGLPPTTLWGYGNRADGTFKHLGGAIVAQRNRPVRVRFFNQLPPTHILPVDDTVPGVEAATMAMRNRVAVHLHGGHVPWPSDGGPHHWFGPGDTGPGAPVAGPSYMQWLPDPSGAMTGDCWYPNQESARLLWYHDHAVGITRLNAYAGLATGYLVQDAAAESVVRATLGIPMAREVPLVFQDKVFSPDGSLWYPSAYDQQFFFLNPGGAPLPPVSLVPEFWGDTMLVNGSVSPYLEVQPRRYRFRVLNACNTRFLSLRLLYAAGQAFPENTEASANDLGPAMQLIGTEGGFLDPAVAPQGWSITGRARLVLAPAERADLVIDFSKVRPGSFLILHNDAPVPFPGGTPLADFHPKNNRLTVPPAPGFAPNTRSVLQFRVVPLQGSPDPGVTAWSLPPLDPAPLVPSGSTTPPAGARVRDLTLNEAFDEYGRLAQLLGTATPPDPALPLAFGRSYMDPATETPGVGDVEVWRIFNLSADAHPIHFHIANVLVLSRQPFNVRQFTGVPRWTGRARPAEPDEMGWKETVKMHPGECTTVLMRFDLPPDPRVRVGGVATTVSVPESPRTGGYEYVWHCHILEHEEHDMMRPLVLEP